MESSNVRIIPFQAEYQEEVATLFTKGLTESYLHKSNTIVNAQRVFAQQKLRRDDDEGIFSNDMHDIFSSYMVPSYENEPRFFWIALDEDDVVVGHVGVCPSTYSVDDTPVLYDSDGLDASNVCELVRMSVSRKVRGQGLGPRLTRVVEDYALEKGMRKVCLSTLAEMDLARKMYEKCGYELFKEATLPSEEVSKMCGEGKWDELVIVHYAKSIETQS